MEFYRARPKISLTDLARISQFPGQSVEQYIMRFYKLRTQCISVISEAECIPMVVRGLNYSMREHFKGHHFRDLFELTTRVASYERLLKEKDQRRSSSKGTYYQDPFEVSTIDEDYETDTDDEAINVAMYVGTQPNECQALKRPTIMKEKKKILKEN